MEITTICRKDKINKHNEVSIAIRIYHNREDKRLSTGLRINADDWDFEHNCLKSDAWNREHIQFILNEKIQAITRKALEFKIRGEEFTIEELLGGKKKAKQTVEAFFQQVIKQLTELGKLNTRDRYKFTLSSLRKFRPMNISFEDIDLHFLKDYEIFLHKSGMMSNTIASRFSTLKAAYNRALEEKIFTCEEHPFTKFKVGRLWVATRKRAITKEDIHRLRELDLTALTPYPTPYLEFSRDIPKEGRVLYRNSYLFSRF